MLRKFNMSIFLNFLLLLIFLTCFSFFIGGMFLHINVLNRFLDWNLFILRKFWLSGVLNLLSLWLDWLASFYWVFYLYLILLNLFKVFFYYFFLVSLLYLLIVFNIILDFINEFLRDLWLYRIFNLLFDHFKIVHINIIKFISLLSDFFLKLIAYFEIFRFNKVTLNNS